MERLTNEKVYRKIARSLQARENCLKHPEPFQTRDEWAERHLDEALRLTDQFLPSGSGFDSGTKLVIEESSSDKLVFTTEFHHMDENGGYDGWMYYKITVTASLCFGIHVEVETLDSDIDEDDDLPNYVLEVFS